ncbi:hypothetical protein Dimus_020355 [Dionaea muscipula]
MFGSSSTMLEIFDGRRVLGSNVESADKETVNAEMQDDDHDIPNVDLEEVNVDITGAADGNDDDDEDNMPLSLKIEALRRGDADDEDNVVLSLKYQAPQQDLIYVNANLEVACENDAEMEVKVVDQNHSVVDDDTELSGIDDVEAFIKITIEKTVDDIFENISEKVDMDLAEEAVRELEGGDNEKTTDVAAKSQTYRRRRKAKMSKRKLIVSESEEVDVDAATIPRMMLS